MIGGGRNPAFSGAGGDEAEVEALLRAAQDAVLLKLQANSHLVSSSSPSSAAAPNPLPSLDPAAADPLDGDLARRFEALRSRPPKLPHAPTSAAAGMDELEARFAALKGAEKGDSRVKLEDLGDESEEEDEVDKVMRWAMDAARLDVATASAGKAKPAAADDDEAEEEEEKDEKSSSVSSEDSDEEEERMELERERKRKEMMSKNKSKSKWFSLF
uniref:Uncharacterized protein n=1 Tax=Leersia perrieri TaxID=77586 RepID=A0A0D9X4F6_9ORYZ